MKATGIVRRIDNLGRVVIPKEIRRTMHIHESDPLEIYTAGNGEVIFKKYSPIGEMGRAATDYAEALAKKTPFHVLICDRDHCIAASGNGKGQMLERRVTTELEDIMEKRGGYAHKGDMARSKALEGVDQNIAVAVPIFTQGDITGCVVLADGEQGEQTPSDSDVMLAQVAADFLGRSIEQ